MTYINITAMHLNIPTYGSFSSHTACSLYRIMVTTTMPCGMMQNLSPKAEIELTYLIFQASVLTSTPARLPYVTTPPDQYRLLQKLGFGMTAE